MADEHFSIDIHYNKLLDWLVDRRHCESKWHSQLHEVRERLEAALKELSDVKELAWISEQPFVNYFDCVRVFEAVKEVDGDSKSLFGQYTSPRVKEWSDILKLYEKKSLYMAECAQQLARNVNYEIPALKKQMKRCQKIQRDCESKEGQLTGSAATLKQMYEVSCSELGIKGENIKEELDARVISELPVLYEKVLSDLPSLISAISYYKAFVKHTVKRKIDDDKFLPMLMYVLTHGNVTVYEWKYNEPPSNQIAETDLGNAKESDDLEIDWGDIVSSSDDQQALPAEPEIDFGDEAGIDFGESEIDFGVDIDLSAITIEDSGEVGREDIDKGPVSPGIQTSPADLETVLGSTHTRNLFLDDLMELKEFLAQRISELSKESSSMLVYGQFGGSDCSDELGVQSEESIAEMLGHVTKVLTHLTGGHNLFLLKGSQRYQERMTQPLLLLRRLAQKALSQVPECAMKRKEATELGTSLEPKLTSLIKCVKELQKQVVADISKRYGNRVVNIIGEINEI